MRTAIFYAHFGGDPYFNMACDEWLMEAARRSPETVFLRLYTWRPGTVTIGLNQRADSAYDASYIGSTPIIRRVTGGRALYHDLSELTYAVALDTDGADHGSGLTGSISETSRIISEALAAFVDSCGRPVSYVKTSSPENARPDFFHRAPCFASRARYELTDPAGKVVASAQRRIGSVLLQHGSIKLFGVAPHPALPGVGERSTNFVSHEITPDLFMPYASQWAASLAAGLDLEITTAALTATECEAIHTAADRLRENPLSRRDPIKQSAVGGSL